MAQNVVSQGSVRTLIPNLPLNKTVIPSTAKQPQPLASSSPPARSLGSESIPFFAQPTDPRHLLSSASRKELVQLDPTTEEFRTGLKLIGKLGYPTPTEVLPDTSGPRTRTIGDETALISTLVRKSRQLHQERVLTKNPKPVVFTIPGGMLGGKSTFAASLQQELTQAGLPVERFGTDSFYLSRLQRYKEGLHNTHERFAPEYSATLRALRTGGSAQVPKFDEFKGERLSVSQDPTAEKVVILEGAQTGASNARNISDFVVHVAASTPTRIARGGVRDLPKQTLKAAKETLGQTPLSPVTAKAIQGIDTQFRTASVIPGLNLEVEHKLLQILESDPATKPRANSILRNAKEATGSLFNQRLMTDSADCLNPAARRLTQIGQGNGSEGVGNVFGEPESFVLRTDIPGGQAYRVGRSPEPYRSSIRMFPSAPPTSAAPPSATPPMFVLSGERKPIARRPNLLEDYLAELKASESPTLATSRPQTVSSSSLPSARRHPGTESVSSFEKLGFSSPRTELSHNPSVPSLEPMTPRSTTGGEGSVCSTPRSGLRTGYPTPRTSRVLFRTPSPPTAKNSVPRTKS
ncbi:MAG: hypothetical protein WC860_03665 [Candidatus Margulisiibacteriota bacterium]|jgi:uridine kinase